MCHRCRTPCVEPDNVQGTIGCGRGRGGSSDPVMWLALIHRREYSRGQPDVTQNRVHDRSLRPCPPAQNDRSLNRMLMIDSSCRPGVPWFPQNWHPCKERILHGRCYQSIPYRRIAKPRKSIVSRSIGAACQVGPNQRSPRVPREGTFHVCSCQCDHGCTMPAMLGLALASAVCQSVRPFVYRYLPAGNATGRSIRHESWREILRAYRVVSSRLH